MKLTSIKSVKSEQNRTNNGKNNKKTNFKGGADALIKTWQIIDNSRALQFTVEDMLGTNIPRTYKGAMAGYKYTGKVNVPALLQEAIREFLTGPTMCTVPIAVLALAKKNMGKSSGTHIENIRNLSHLAQSATGKAENFKDSFYRTVAEDMLGKTLGNNGAYSSDDTDAIVQGLKKYDEILAQPKPKDKIAKKALKQQKEEALNSLQSTFSKILKGKSKDYKSSDFLNVTYSITEKATGTTNFKNYMEYTTAYAQDLTKKAKGVVDSETIKNFKNSWVGKRALVIGSMIGLTGICMSFIPKIYTWASGGVNPNASAIYDEAQGKNTKPQKKEVK